MKPMVKQSAARRGPEKKPQSPAAAGGAPKLDRLIHERVRLGILGALAAHETLTFNELKGRLGVTDGNLSMHSRKLEEAGYVACAKSFEDRKPRTGYRLTAAGRRALGRYLDSMEALIKSLRDR